METQIKKLFNKKLYNITLKINQISKFTNEYCKNLLKIKKNFDIIEIHNRP